MKLRSLALPLCMSLCFGAGLAEAQEGRSAVEGLGLRSCSDVVAARDDNAEQYRGFAAWMTGFLSAANAYETETFDLTPWQSIEVSMAQVALYCDANPDTPFVQAVAAYLRFLRTDRLTAPSEMEQLRNGETAVFVYRTVLERIGALLRAEGLLDANAGDTFDTAFGNAILAYQRKNDLIETGLPDTPTLLKMFQTGGGD